MLTQTTSEAQPPKRRKTMPRAISNVTGAEVQILMAKFDRAAKHLPWQSTEAIPFHDLSTPHEGTTNRPPKHLKQLESLHRNLVKAGLCEPGSSFCEMGAGTGKLSDHVSERLQGDSTHYLIDRKVFGHKRLRDRCIAARGKDGNLIRRITMDIADIKDLRMLCDVESDDKLTVISKHLCGPAADFSIQCCATSRLPLAVATCCHYLCDLSSFTNTSFFTLLGFTTRDFEVMTIVSQWASIDKASGIREKNHHESGWVHLPALPELPSDIDIQLMSSEHFETTFAREEKVRLGKRSKLFLDTARLYRLQELGYRTKLIRYTTMSIENHLLIASPKSQDHLSWRRMS